MTTKFKAIEFGSAGEAIQHASAAGGEAVLIHSRHMVVDSRTLDMLDNARVEFAYLCDHELPDLPAPVCVRIRTGRQAGGSHRIVTIPVNG